MIKRFLNFFVVSLIACTVLAGHFWLEAKLSEGRGFPLLKPGAYVGQIILEESKVPLNIYVEKIARGNRLLLIAFEVGATPIWSTQEDLSPHSPLNFEFRKTNLSLTGVTKTNSIHGAVRQNGKLSGRWRLKTATKGDLSVKSIQPSSELAATHIALFRNQSSLKKSENLLAQQTEVEMVKNTIQRSGNAELMAKQLLPMKQLSQTLDEQAAAAKKALKESSEELAQLLRITPIGRTIDLERRLANRETKWFVANWEETSGVTRIERELADKMNLDFSKLDSEYQKLTDISDLKARIEEEKRRISQLKQRKNSLGQAESAEQEESQGKKGNSSWWDRWSNIF